MTIALECGLPRLEGCVAETNTEEVAAGAQIVTIEVGQDHPSIGACTIGIVVQED